MIDYTSYLTAIFAVLIYFLLRQVKERRRKAAATRKLAERELDEPRLARNLFAFATVSIQRGQPQEALYMLDLAVEIYRRQLAEGATEFRHALADSLSAMAVGLLRLERYQEALASVDEAITITRALAENDYDASQLAENIELRRHILGNANEGGNGS